MAYRARRDTWDVGGIDRLLASKTGVAVGDDLFNEEDEGKPALAKLPQDPETIVVDPDVAAAVDGVVEGVEARHGASHLSSSFSRPLSLSFP